MPHLFENSYVHLFIQTVKVYVYLCIGEGSIQVYFLCIYALLNPVGRKEIDKSTQGNKRELLFPLNIFAGKLFPIRCF